MPTCGESTIGHDMSVYLKTASRRQIQPLQPISYGKIILSTEEDGSFIMLKEKIPNLSFLALTFISFSSCLTLFPLENSKVEAALNVERSIDRW